MEELDIDKGAGNMCCDCSRSKYCYEPAGHVITGDLKIVKDAELRGLIEKDHRIGNRTILSGMLTRTCGRRQLLSINVNGHRRKELILEL